MRRVRVIGGALAALAVSGVLHAAGLVAALPRAAPVAVAGGGGGGAEPAALGTAFADFAAGAIPVAAVATPAVRPQAAVAPVKPVPQVAAMAEPVAVAMARPVVPLAGGPVATVPVEAVPSRPVGPAETVVAGSDLAPDVSPAPPVRPAPARPDAARQVAAQAAGNAEADARRGSADGQETARGAAPGPAAVATDETGTAAASTYPGQVLRQITRLRRPRAPDRGTVMVTFTIAASGALDSVSVAQSSGSAALDRLALDHVRRAAPFPPPPDRARAQFRFEFVGRP